MPNPNAGFHVWDGTVDIRDFEVVELKKLLREHCNKWVFQVQGEECFEYIHYRHYRIRVSLKEKAKDLRGKDVQGYWFATRDNTFTYALQETRIDGPWSDKDETAYIPSNVRNITLSDIQKSCIRRSPKPGYTQNIVLARFGRQRW